MIILNNIKRNVFLKNTSWMVVEKIIEMLVTLAIGVITTRYLGPTNYGIINYSLSFIAIFTFVANLGLDGIIINFLVLDNTKEAKIVGTSIFMRIISSTLSIILVFITIKFVEPGNELLISVSFIQSISLIFKSFEVIEIWFQFKLDSKKSAIAKIISIIGVAIFKLFLVLSKSGINLFAWSVVIQSLISAVLLSVLYFKNNGSKLSIDLKMGKKLLSQSHHFIISGMIMVIYTQIDKIMIGKYMNEINVGYYSASMMIAQLWFFIPNSVINSARPIILKFKTCDNQVYIKKLTQLFSFIIFSGILVSLVITIFSEEIIYILYGKEYILSAKPLTINVWAGIFALLGVARDIWYVAEEKINYSKIFIMIGACINVLLNMTLIPVMGINGAAIATLITQISVCFVLPLFCKGTRRVSLVMLNGLNIKNVWRR